MGFFKKIKDALKKTREALSQKIDYIFSAELDEDFYEELLDILIASDMGFETSQEICDNLREYAKNNNLKTKEDVKNALKVVIKQIIDQVPTINFEYPAILTIVGVNGVGKTTSIGKMAAFFKRQKKDVVLVAGDTFRAAASKQLSMWADRNKVRVIKHSEGADAAAVVFDSIVSAKAKKTDVLLVDTAGRLHTKTNLMQELEKINKIISREYSEANHYTFIVIDATTGQNAINQLNAFGEYVKIDGIILTKLDGTAKGGVIVSIAKQTLLPVTFVGTGEQIDDLEEFDSQNFVDNLF